jgi:acetyl/propionyl-CoA carboxylase alpha subunit
VYSGYEISPYYDALIAKLIVHESTRKETIERMKRALEEYRVLGVKTNIPFHQHLLENPDFIKGDFNTQFVGETLPPLTAIQKDDPVAEIAALVATLVAHQESQHSALKIQGSQREVSNWKWVSRWEQTRE